MPHGILIKIRGSYADMRIMERRSEVRMLCADMVEVRWKAAGKNRRAMALLEDISPSGACLQLEEALPLDVKVQWECPKQEFTGHVRYCVYREIGYFVGVQFVDASKWSKKTYEPQHLLDLRSLMGHARK